MNSLTTEVGYISLNKRGEELCGDKVEIINQDDSATLVLADGLGSGVKANILATLTSKIIATMMANKMPVEECVRTIASTLPVCAVRKIAYATFTIMQVEGSEEITLIQFDNPDVIMLRSGVSMEYPKQQLVIDSKKVSISVIKVRPDDIFVAMSDGALYAGVGKTFNYGWQRGNIIDYLEARYTPDMSAKMAASIIAEECDRLYEHEPGDDTTIAAIRIRRRQTVNLIIGPPSSAEDDRRVLALFFSKEGKKIVCGGSTSEMVSRYLDKPVKTSTEYHDPAIPPTGSLEGVDLVTEGVITMSRVLEYAKEYADSSSMTDRWSSGKDAASLISQLLFEEATDINFFVGRAINPAHQNPELPISIAIKLGLIEELAVLLEKMGKRIRVNYF